jgi:hypothetical protein
MSAKGIFNQVGPRARAERRACGLVAGHESTHKRASHTPRTLARGRPAVQPQPISLRGVLPRPDAPCNTRLAAAPSQPCRSPRPSLPPCAPPGPPDRAGRQGRQPRLRRAHHRPLAGRRLRGAVGAAHVPRRRVCARGEGARGRGLGRGPGDGWHGSRSAHTAAPALRASVAPDHHVSPPPRRNVQIYRDVPIPEKGKKGQYMITSVGFGSAAVLSKDLTEEMHRYCTTFVHDVRPPRGGRRSATCALMSSPAEGKAPAACDCLSLLPQHPRL